MSVDRWAEPTVLIVDVGFGANHLALLFGELDVVGGSNGWSTAPPDDGELGWAVGVGGLSLADVV